MTNEQNLYNIYAELEGEFEATVIHTVTATDMDSAYQAGREWALTVANYSPDCDIWAEWVATL